MHYRIATLESKTQAAIEAVDKALSDLDKTEDSQKPYALVVAACAAGKIDANQGQAILLMAIKAFNDLDKRLNSNWGLRESERTRLIALRKQAKLLSGFVVVVGPAEKSRMFSLEVPGVSVSFRQALTALNNQAVDAFSFLSQFEDNQRQLQFLPEALEYAWFSSKPVNPERMSQLP